MQLSIKKETERVSNSEKMSDSAVLPSISSAAPPTVTPSSTASTPSLQIFPQTTAASLAQVSLAGLRTLQADSINGSENSSAGGNSPIANTNTVSLMQAAAASQAVALQQQQPTNQTDYFRNCNVPNLINKWRRRHTWLFLREGKMFCQVNLSFFSTTRPLTKICGFVKQVPPILVGFSCLLLLAGGFLGLV